MTFNAQSTKLFAVIGAVRAYDDVSSATNPIVTALFPNASAPKAPQRVAWSWSF